MTATAGAGGGDIGDQTRVVIRLLHRGIQQQLADAVDPVQGGCAELQSHEGVGRRRGRGMVLLAFAAGRRETHPQVAGLALHALHLHVEVHELAPLVRLLLNAPTHG